MSFSSSTISRDFIFVKDLYLKTSLPGVGNCWEQAEPQPIIISSYLRTPITNAGKLDYLPYSIHYGTVADTIRLSIENKNFLNTENGKNESNSKSTSLEKIACEVANAALSVHAEEILKVGWVNCGAQSVQVDIKLPKSLLRSDSVGITAEIPFDCNKNNNVNNTYKVYIENLNLVTLIGIHPWERKKKQCVILNVSLYKKFSSNQDNDKNIDFRAASDLLIEFVETSEFYTVEALALSAINHLLKKLDYIEKVTIKVEKPSAVPFTNSVGVEVTRTQKDIVSSCNSLTKANSGEIEAYIAVGSNVGNRFKNIFAALEYLDSQNEVSVIDSSALYESIPMYYTDQRKFINGVVKIRTTLSPRELLKVTQNIEDNELHRVKLIEKGPRSVDLDILTYGEGEIVNFRPDSSSSYNGTLFIPHLLMLEREFVLRPLVDIAPNEIHPLSGLSYSEHLNRLENKEGMLKVCPLAGESERYLTFGDNAPTKIMAIVNMTPDSFSDGGLNTIDSISDLTEKYMKKVKPNRLIIDIGGQSTHPKSTFLSAKEELGRVIPAIEVIKEARNNSGIYYGGAEGLIPISIDTFHASVAEGAIKAGADIINDISGGSLDNDILNVVAKQRVPIIIMHMRGTPQNMKENEINEIKDGEDIIEIIGNELSERIQLALDKGVRRWQIILDPGLGFAKSSKVSVELLSRLDELIKMPKLQGVSGWLVGSSRKGFIGKVTGVSNPKERIYGTIATVGCSIEKGADIVRVHDVCEVSEATLMLDAIYKTT